jgi:hypothetical protein
VTSLPRCFICGSGCGTSIESCRSGMRSIVRCCSRIFGGPRRCPSSCGVSVHRPLCGSVVVGVVSCCRVVTR